MAAIALEVAHGDTRIKSLGFVGDAEPMTARHVSFHTHQCEPPATNVFEYAPELVRMMPIHVADVSSTSFLEVAALEQGPVFTRIPESWAMRVHHTSFTHSIS